MTKYFFKIHLFIQNVVFFNDKTHVFNDKINVKIDGSKSLAKKSAHKMHNHNINFRFILQFLFIVE
jgi:hypothetical protein